MFASHTPTRMKGSAIVHGLRSWASALHPQLPLSRRESQRLLTALTSSFRRQLDEAHPPHHSADARPQLDQSGDAGVKGERSQGLHSSSAVYADRHLQSVLTNPLLAQVRAPQQPEPAKVVADALGKTPGKNAIDLLENLQEQGRATIPIAVACLKNYYSTIERLPEEKRKAAIAGSSAGKRVLLWLWQHRIHEDEQFITETALANLTASLVVQEGYEKYLWEWLQLDLAQYDNTATPFHARAHMADLRRPHRWRGAVIRSLVAAKLELQPPGKPPSLDEAIQVLLRAMALRNSSLIPLKPSVVTIGRAASTAHKRCMATDPALFDGLIAAQQSPQIFSACNNISQYDVCLLQLKHPTHPDPLPALELLRKTLHPRPEKGSDADFFQSYVSDPRSRRAFTLFLFDTAAHLEDFGHAQDAAWVASAAKLFDPTLAPTFEGRVQLRQRFWRSIRDEAARAAGSPAPTSSKRTGASASEFNTEDGAAAPAAPQPSLAV